MCRTCRTGLLSPGGVRPASARACGRATWPVTWPTTATWRRPTNAPTPASGWPRRPGTRFVIPGDQSGTRTAWDFSAEPEFEEKLSRIRRFVRDEFIPQETHDLDAAAFSRPTGPLKEEQKTASAAVTSLPAPTGLSAEAGSCPAQPSSQYGYAGCQSVFAPQRTRQGWRPGTRPSSHAANGTAAAGSTAAGVLPTAGPGHGRFPAR